MAIRRRFTRRRPRRTRRKAVSGFRRKNAVTTIRYKPSVFNSAPFPGRMFGKYSYAESDILGPGAAMAIHQYRTYQFDPDVAVGGHQPMYRDQMYNIYQYSRTVGMSYDITFMMITPLPEVGEVNVLHKNTPAVVSTFNMAMERPLGKSYMLTANNKQRLRGYISAPRVWGITKEQYKYDQSFWEDSTGLTPAGVPPKNAILHLNAQSMSAGNIQIRYMMKLVLYTEFFDRIPIAQS